MSSEWHHKHQQHFHGLQHQIDQHTYALQRAQRGNPFFGDLLYPIMYQKDLQSLAILKKQQWLGSIDQSEVDAYKIMQPDTADALNRAFTHVFPLKGALVGGTIFGACHLMNVGYSFRLAGLAVPMLYDVVISRYLASRGKSAEFKSMEFMDWCLKMRQAKAQYEATKGSLDQALMAEYQKQCGALSVHKAMNQLASL